MSLPPVIQTRDLTRYYGATVGLEGLDLEVEPGEVFGFLGPNGAGKTTTIRLLLDLIRPTRGSCALFGTPSATASTRSRIGYLPGELTLDGRMTGRQTLRFLSALGGSRDSAPTLQEELCERLGLPPGDLKKRVRDYSRGMKQKLGLVSAFQHEPDLLILDEPTTGLDPLVREEVLHLMLEAKARGGSVFHSSHVLSEVDRTCDRVAVLRDGRRVALLSVAEAREASARSMVVVFKTTPPIQELEAIGAVVEGTAGFRVTLRVTGELDSLLRIFATHPVQHLSFPEPSLEEAFNTYYQPGSSQEDRP